MPDNASQPVAINEPPTELSPASNKKQAARSRPDPMILKLFRLAFQIGGHLAPSIAGRIAYRLWFTPMQHKTPASEKNILESADIEHIDIHNHSIATYRWGQSGPTVLLVHGWSGRGTQMGPFVEPLIKAGYRVLSFDAPAHGKSSGKQTNAYEVADTLLALQHHYGSFDSVITHSFGGPCTALAIQRGLETKRLISISPPATIMNLVEKYVNILRIPAKAGSHLIRCIETNFGKTVWDDISMLNTVKELKIPGMLIHDINDADVPWQEGHAVAQAWNNARFIKTSGLGHRRILRDTTIIESIVSFINDNK